MLLVATPHMKGLARVGLAQFLPEQLTRAESEFARRYLCKLSARPCTRSFGAVQGASDFNRNIVGVIEVIATFAGEPGR